MLCCLSPLLTLFFFYFEIPSMGFACFSARVYSFSVFWISYKVYWIGNINVIHKTVLLMVRSYSVYLAINLVLHSAKYTCSVMVSFTSRVSNSLPEMTWSFYLSLSIGLVLVLIRNHNKPPSSLLDITPLQLKKNEQTVKLPFSLR